jgi:hypothetical protein
VKIVTTVCRVVISYYLMLCVNYFVYSLYDIAYNSITGGSGVSGWSVTSMFNSVVSIIVGLGLAVHKIMTVKRLKLDEHFQSQ